MDINKCNCGSTNKPQADSDDMVPCWIIECPDCGQKRHSPNGNWSYNNALREWNKHNPITPDEDKPDKES